LWDSPEIFKNKRQITQLFCGWGTFRIYLLSISNSARFRQKIDIMLNHQLDVKRVFVTHIK